MERFNEDTRVKFPATIHFLRLGYSYESYNKNIEKGNIDKSTKIFKNIFKKSVSKINNRDFSDDEIESILMEINKIISFNDLGKEFYQWLINPMEKVKLIDWDNVDNNTFNVVNELRFGDQEIGHFRPDINILINGIPLAFLEVKKPNNEGGIQVEFDRMVKERYQKIENRKYFNLIQLTCFSNNMVYETDDDRENEPKQGSFYSTPNGNLTTFNFFREERKDTVEFIEDNESIIKYILEDNNYKPELMETLEYKTNIVINTPCNSFITSLFEKHRLLFLLKYGILYVDKDIKEKHIMRYPQFFAALAILDRIKTGKKSGIIWHTQGSGKTALSVYTNRILKDFYAKQGINIRFFYVVDRLELLTQVKQEFEIRGCEAVSVNSKEEFLRELNRVLDKKNNQNAFGSCVVVNIQKFSDSLPEIKNYYNAKVQRIIFVDEAHRSYAKSTGEFYKNLMLVDRDAIFIAMTGTPLLTKKERSNLRFGDYIHKYFYDRSILDGYTLKIKKEEMETVAKAEIKRNLELELKGKDKTTILESDEYICALGEYINNDFTNFRYINDDQTIGAMIVCNSNGQAKKIQKWFENNSKFNTRLVISDEEIPAQLNKNNQNEFKSAKSGIDIMVVHLMLTTGYDVPRLKKMYLLRFPKKHSLLQTISRVNRPYKSPNGKIYQFGYVSDFVDITEEYDRTVANYLKELNEELEDLDENSPSADTLVFDVNKIQEKYDNAIKTLIDIQDIDNLELFSRFLEKINEKSPLFRIRKLINTILDCKTEFLLSHEDDKAKKIDKNHFKELAKLVQSRIDFLNVCDKPIEVMSILNKEIVEIMFHFIKIKTVTLDMKSLTEINIKSWLTKLNESIKNMKNKDDIRVIKLDELLREIFNKLQIANFNVDELNEKLKTAVEEASRINEENEKLSKDFGGNFAYVKTYQDILRNNSSLEPDDCKSLLLCLEKAITNIQKINNLILLGRTNFITYVKKETTGELYSNGLYKKLVLKEIFDFVLGQLFVNLQLY